MFTGLLKLFAGRTPLFDVVAFDNPKGTSLFMQGNPCVKP
ncbi:hypothetical protein HMPREF0972_01114 [Actinomyces sp. oral taxon 848 str. F0332]|nr:hypothetical protein HMPREF0972_01114 [Actinomyces sp. oral taxon 848 str. F0332]